jgi:hypothetical protein
MLSAIHKVPTLKKNRKSPIAKALTNNSISAYYSAIEIHNKPNFKYRYETVTILVINSWELLLKAFIYKFRKKVKLFYKDGTTKPFPECLSFVMSELGKNYFTTQKNIELIYEYRNKAVHFYNQNLSILIYSLIAKNVRLYSNFLKEHFKLDLSESSDLVLLPIGFKRPFSPVDFISNESTNTEAPKPVKDYVESIISATTYLNNIGIEDSILVDFKISLVNVNKITNADIIAAVNNTSKQQLNFTVSKQPSVFKVAKEEGATAVRITRDKTQSQGLLVHEELSDGIFEEINNVIDANEKLRNGKSEFMLDENVYYRIYSERSHVNFSQEIFQIMINATFSKFYAPSFFWISSLPASNIAKIITQNLTDFKAPYINSLVRFFVLLGEEGIEWLNIKLTETYKKVLQKPDFFYGFQKVRAKKNATDLKLRALRISGTRIIELPISKKSVSINYLMENKLECANELSKICLSVFEGNKDNRAMARLFDYLSYGDIIIEHSSEILEEIKLVSR